MIGVDCVVRVLKNEREGGFVVLKRRGGIGWFSDAPFVDVVWLFVPPLILDVPFVVGAMSKSTGVSCG